MTRDTFRELDTDQAVLNGEPVNLASDLERRTLEGPDRVALIFEDGRRWSYAELDAAAGGVAQALRDAGVRRGERIALYLRNSPELLFALFACWKVGAVPITVSSMYNAAELVDSITKTNPVMLLGDDHDLPATRSAAATSGTPTRLISGLDPDLDALNWSPYAGLASVAVEAEDESGILFTGGTTGKPKAVIQTHGGVRSALERLAQVSKGRPGPYDLAPIEASPNLVALPLFHGGGQHTLLFALHVGRSIALWERFRVATLDAMVRDYRFDNMFLLPTMLYDIVHAEPALDLSSVRTVLIAGQALSIHLRRDFEQRYGIPIVMNYGSTETGHIAGWTAADMRAGLWKPGSAGRVYDGVELEIRDENGRALGPNENGEIAVRASITTGYVGDHVATAELIRDGWVHSGDMGYLDDDGVLFLSGRKRDMIKCGGFQVWPDEIEETLRSHRLVDDVRVLGVPDERLGEIPKAIVVRADDPSVSDEVLADELIALSRERLAHFKAPREVAFVAELPRSEAGKVRRDDLAAEEALAQGSSA